MDRCHKDKYTILLKQPNKENGIDQCWQIQEGPIKEKDRFSHNVPLTSVHVRSIIYGWIGILKSLTHNLIWREEGDILFIFPLFLLAGGWCVEWKVRTESLAGVR